MIVPWVQVIMQIQVNKKHKILILKNLTNDAYYNLTLGSHYLSLKTMEKFIVTKKFTKKFKYW